MTISDKLKELRELAEQHEALANSLARQNLVGESINVKALCSALERAVEALEFIRGAANGQEARASRVPAEFVEATLSDVAKLLEAK